MPIPGWSVDIHGTDDDYTTGAPFASVSAATVSALTNHTTASLFIVEPRPDWSREIASLVSADGTAYGMSTRRRTFDIQFYPFTWADSSQDLLDVDAFEAVLDAPFLWLRVNTPDVGAANDRSWPNSAATVMPVYLTGRPAANVDAARGRRRHVWQFAHRYEGLG